MLWVGFLVGLVLFLSLIGVASASAGLEASVHNSAKIVYPASPVAHWQLEENLNRLCQSKGSLGKATPY